MLRSFAACMLMLLLNAAHAQVTTAPAIPPVTTATTLSATVDRAASITTDPVAATQVFMNRLQGEARAKSDAYAEGGYWLLLWNFLYGLLVAWLLLSMRISSRMRDFAEQRTHRKNLQTLIYLLMYVPLLALLTLPITFYEGFYQ